MKPFRIVIFSSMLPSHPQQFLWRLSADLPQVVVAGVLYETKRRQLSRRERVKRAVKLSRDPDFIGYSVDKVRRQFRIRLEHLLDRLLRMLHAAPENSNRLSLSLIQLKEICKAKGIAFEITNDIHSEASLEFVRSLGADLGVIYGTRILKPQLFSIPRLGSINIHKHKVPEYRGSGAPGIWEMRDGKTEQGVTVHRVLKEVDAGGVVGEQSFSIEPFDTLTSVGLKADLVGFDCLIDVIGRASRGVWEETPQASQGTVYKGFQPHQFWAIEREILKKRKPFKPVTGRPLHKLVPRMLTYPALYFRNRRRARTKNFPVVILYHHLVTDRPMYMGLSTEQFFKHIRYLKKHYRIASLPEAMDMLHKGEVSEPTVVLTFDDGYRDNFICLRAVVEAENVPVTLFVCTDNIAKGSPFQHDLDRKELGFPPMTWDQVRYFDHHGVTIGSHTRTHFDCGSTDEAKLTSEIVGSLDDLRKELGHDVFYFSFPWGHPQNMSNEARRIAAETYSYVFSAFGGVSYGPLGRNTVIKRYGHPASLVELELLLQGVLDWDWKLRKNG